MSLPRPIWGPAADSQGTDGFKVALALILASVVAVLLLLLGYRLRRRRKQTAHNRDVNGDIEAKASAQAAADIAEADAQPMPELAPDCSAGQPVNGQRPMSTDSLLPSALPATVNPPPLPGTLGVSPSTLPATPDVDPSTLPATLDVNPSTLPAPVLLWCQRGAGQGKLVEAVEAAPESKAARSRARRASIKDTEAALAEMFALSARGTKDGPGRFSSRSGASPAAHSRAPRKGSPDSIWAPVRARHAAMQAANALREPDLPDRHARTRKMHIKRERQLSKERSQRLLRSHHVRKGLSSQEELVRV